MKLKTLDIILVDSDTFLANSIHKFQGNRFNHAGLVVNILGRTYIVEALKHGIGFTPLWEYEKDRKDGKCDYIFLRSKNNLLSLTDNDSVLHFILPYTRNGYEYTNLLFFQAIKYIAKKLFNKELWIGTKRNKSSKKFICGEWVGFVYNHFFGLFDDWHKIAPVDLFNSSDFYKVG